MLDGTCIVLAVDNGGRSDTISNDVVCIDSQSIFPRGIVVLLHTVFPSHAKVLPRSAAWDTGGSLLYADGWAIGFCLCLIVLVVSLFGGKLPPFRFLGVNCPGGGPSVAALEFDLNLSDTSLIVDILALLRSFGPLSESFVPDVSVTPEWANDGLLLGPPRPRKANSFGSLPSDTRSDESSSSCLAIKVPTRGILLAILEDLRADNLCEGLESPLAVE